MALSPDGGLLAVERPVRGHHPPGHDHTVAVAIINPAQPEAEGLFFAMSFSPDGQTLAASSPQGQIFLWSLANPGAPQLKFRLPGQRRPLASIVFDAEGRRLASCALFESMVEIWNLELLDRELAGLGIGD